jgi:hypothetical protein
MGDIQQWRAPLLLRRPVIRVVKYEAYVRIVKRPERQLGHEVWTYAL